MKNILDHTSEGSSAKRTIKSPTPRRFIPCFKSDSNLSINPGIKEVLPPTIIFEQISARTLSSIFSTASNIVSAIPLSLLDELSPINIIIIYYLIFII